MSGPREGPNPLRPYYIPPSIGFPPESSGAGSSGYRHGGNNGTSNYASTARDMFPDLDYSNYVPEGSQSTLDMMKEILDEAMYKYLAILLAQPFDVAKTILQVRTQATGDGTIPISAAENVRERTSQYRDSTYVDVGGCLLCMLRHILIVMASIFQTTQIPMNLHTLRIQHHLRLHLVTGDRGGGI
jgi:fusion and transport protein UGO1